MSWRAVTSPAASRVRGLDAEHDLAGVGLRELGEEAQRPGQRTDARPAARPWRRGRACPSGRCAARPACGGAGHHVVAGDAGRLVDDHQAVDDGRPTPGQRRPRRSAAPGPRRISLDALGLRITSSGRNCRIGVLRAWIWRPTAACRRTRQAAERLQHLGVAGLAGEGVVVDDGAVEVGVDVDRRDAHELQAGVVDALQLLGHDLAQELAQAGRARALCRESATVGGGSPCSFQPPPVGRAARRARGGTRRSGPPCR